MKKILFSAAGILFCLGVKAQTDNPKSDTLMRYCAKVIDGMIVVMQDGRQLTQTLTLSNGTDIGATGTVTKKNGDTFILKEGDCVDGNGDLIQPNTKTKK